MSLSEKEILLIVQKRDELRIVSQETLDLLYKEAVSPLDINEIKKKILHILSLVHIISSQVNTKANLSQLIPIVAEIVDCFENPKHYKEGMVKAEALCFIVNMISYSYSRVPSFFKTVLPFGYFEVRK